MLHPILFIKTIMFVSTGKVYCIDRLLLIPLHCVLHTIVRVLPGFWNLLKLVYFILRKNLFNLPDNQS